MLNERFPTQAVFLLVLLVALLGGCNTTPGPVIATGVSQTPTRTVLQVTKVRDLPLPSATPIPSITSLPPRSETPTTPTIPQVCSPLADIELNLLPDLVSNPFAPPPSGSDLPHQGVDLSLLDPVGEYALEGHPVQAVLAGEVSAVIQDRFPYGYTLLIETRTQEMPPLVRSALVLPTPLPYLLTPVSLTCPPTEAKHSVPSENQNEPTTPDAALQERSIYVLYAHLQSLPDIQVGAQVQCGQLLGLIGASGNALYPHLHIEIRVGPPGMRFDGIAHYDNSATLVEMANYCTWRVSGLFQLIDPMDLFSLDPE